MCDNTHSQLLLYDALFQELTDTARKDIRIYLQNDVSVKTRLHTTLWLQAASVGGQCRRLMQATSVGGQCRRLVQAVSVGGLCRRLVQASSVGGQYRRLVQTDSTNRYVMYVHFRGVRVALRRLFLSRSTYLYIQMCIIWC